MIDDDDIWDNIPEHIGGFVEEPPAHLIPHAKTGMDVLRASATIPVTPAASQTGGGDLVAALRAQAAAEQAIYDRFVYHEQSMDWLDMEQLKPFDEKAFGRLPAPTALFRANVKIAMIQQAKGPVPSAAMTMLPIVRRVDDMVMIYGEERLCDAVVNGTKQRCLNLYKPSLLQPSPDRQCDDDVRPFLDHIAKICRRDPQTGTVLLDWMAWITQNLDKKVLWAPLIYSTQGIGKDIMLRPLTAIIGAHNCIDIGPSDLERDFNRFDACKLVVLNEMLNNTRYSTYDRLKVKISGSGSGYVSINPKYGREYQVKNLAAWIVFTNHPDAMPMEQGDRRFYVIHGEQPCSPEEKAEYFSRLADWMEAGVSCLFRWLLDRDVSSFNPFQPPKDTAAKAEMQWEAMTENARWLASTCQVGAFADRTILTRAEINHLADRELLKIGDRQITDGLRASGFHSIGVHPVEGGKKNLGKRTTFYARNGVTWQGTETRDVMLSEMTPGIKAEVFGFGLPSPLDPDKIMPGSMA